MIPLGDEIDALQLKPEAELEVIMNLDDDLNYDLIYYLSGPMTGFPEFNFPAFETAASILRDHDLTVHSPHEIEHGETPETRGQLPYQTYMKAAYEMLLGCNGIILLPGWPQSPGARAELDIAILMKMPVFTFNWSGDKDDAAILMSMDMPR